MLTKTIKTSHIKVVEQNLELDWTQGLEVQDLEQYIWLILYNKKEA